MIVRSLTQSDIAPAVAIVVENYPAEREYIRRVQNELDSAFIDAAFRPSYVVAEEDGQLCGFAGYIQSPMDYSIYELFWVNVRPAQQHHGVGSALVDAMLQRIQDAGGTTILLSSQSPAFYERWGFTVLMPLEKGYVLMQKRFE